MRNLWPIQLKIIERIVMNFISSIWRYISVKTGQNSFKCSITETIIKLNIAFKFLRNCNEPINLNELKLFSGVGEYFYFNWIANIRYETNSKIFLFKLISFIFISFKFIFFININELLYLFLFLQGYCLPFCYYLH